MGYFARKLDRGRTRKRQRYLAAQPTSVHTWKWLSLDNGFPTITHNRRYVRFATDRTDEDSKQPEGLFQGAFRILRSIELHRSHRDELHAILDWFNDHLAAPNRVYHRAIFWYKLDDPEFTRKTWPLVQSLQRCGCRVRMMIAQGLPGHIEYEDPHQVAVVVHSDARILTKSLPEPSRVAGNLEINKRISRH